MDDLYLDCGFVQGADVMKHERRLNNRLGNLRRQYEKILIQAKKNSTYGEVLFGDHVKKTLIERKIVETQRLLVLMTTGPNEA